MQIAVQAFDGMTMFHLAAPLLVFGEVGRIPGGESWRTVVWSAEGRGIRTAEGLVVSEVEGPEVLDAADLLVFPSWPEDLPPAGPTLTDAMHRAHGRGARLAGLCLGAFPLVDSGLLDGRRAVTHWAAADQLAGRRPSVSVDAAALYVDHGDVITSAGTASAIDACLHIVRTRLGSAFATAVSRRLVVAPHRDGGQAQYVARPVADQGEVGHLTATLEWASARPGQAVSVDDLAQHAQMSRRNFTRRFAEVTGTSPAKWMMARRLDESRRLLETTDWPVARVAAACGFVSSVTFRQNFTAAYATTPSSYRLRFTDGP